MKDSMRLQGVFTNIKIMKKEIKKLIKDGTFDCHGYKFNNDWDIGDINDNVEYLYIEECENNSLI